MSNLLRDHFKEKGTQHQRSSVNTPQQNGVAERANRTLVEMGRCLLKQSGLDKRFWGEAIMTAVYLRNRSPTVACPKMPYEMFHGIPPSLGRLDALPMPTFNPTSARSWMMLPSSASCWDIAPTARNTGLWTYRLRRSCSPGVSNHPSSLLRCAKGLRRAPKWELA
ncbi:hypothetical protein PhCBS80983_g03972 [Powellomyces hirtus]|uniref:Integrase catalytic domain-containing protein n=1 Tax=Powellomyces hirtus TaxID=109895 RepID=A0A507E043_9FUNG|nr:hypothetical protein PhCBS80983_g03972 [Powellomyces hirtus]